MFIKTERGWQPLWRLSPPKPVDAIGLIKDQQALAEWTAAQTVIVVELRHRADERLI